MTAIYPVTFKWTGEAMIPLNPRLADRYYVVGETYRLEPREERSAASHNHYFAAIHEAWQNLPHDLAEHYPTPDHLRKRALIKAGYRDERVIAFATDEDAEKMAAFVRTMDDLAYVATRGNIVSVYTAKSQSMKAMGKKMFQESKDAVLTVIAELIGVTTDELKKNAGMAA